MQKIIVFMMIFLSIHQTFSDRECTGLNTEKHKDLTTETSFPVPRGTEVQVECTTGYTNPAGAALKCLEGTEFSESTEIKCSFPGNFTSMFSYNDYHVTDCN